MTANAPAAAVRRRPPTITVQPWPVCYAVIEPVAGPASLRLRNRLLQTEFDAPSALEPALTQSPPDDCLSGRLHSVRSAATGVIGVSAYTGRHNRAATALAHRLGAPAFHRVHGPFVVFNSDGHAAVSLTDLQLRLLSRFLAIINASIHGHAFGSHHEPRPSLTACLGASTCL